MHILTLLRESEYRGEHGAPDRHTGDPLHNVSQRVYPDDIYSSDAARQYGDGRNDDSHVIGIIQQYRGKPNKSVKIYRAVPKMDNDVRLQQLRKLINYHNKFGFFPVGNSIVHDYEDKFEDLEYDDKQKAVYDAIVSDVEQLSSADKIQITAGDWVTVNRGYAVEHGRNELKNNFRVIEKTVKARDLYTNGDSVHEWGYDPT